MCDLAYEELEVVDEAGETGRRGCQTGVTGEEYRLATGNADISTVSVRAWLSRSEDDRNGFVSGDAAGGRLRT